MAHARTYAKLITTESEYDFTHAELDQLRMLLAVSLKNGTLPQADPPILPTRYENLRDFISESFDETRDLDTEERYLDTQYPDYEYGEPCPNCGHSEYFYETCGSHGTSYFNDGQCVDYKEQHVGDPIQSVVCPECDTTLIKKVLV